MQNHRRCCQLPTAERFSGADKLKHSIYYHNSLTVDFVFARNIAKSSFDFAAGWKYFD